MPSNEISLDSFLKISLISLIFNLIINTFGYLGSKIIFIFSNIGVLIGALLMINIFSKNASGWEGIIGVLAFFELSLIGFGVGVITQIIIWIYKKIKQNKNV